jgi:hypothetical protein
MDSQGLVRIERQTFNDGQTVILDGHLYVDCWFRRCSIQYSGGDFGFLGNNQFEAPRWDFQGPALGTINLLRLVFQSGSDIPQQLFPELFGPTPKNKAQ